MAKCRAGAQKGPTTADIPVRTRSHRPAMIAGSTYKPDELKSQHKMPPMRTNRGIRTEIFPYTCREISEEVPVGLPSRYTQWNTCASGYLVWRHSHLLLVPAGLNKRRGYRL